MIIFAKIRISVDYRIFILRNVHPARISAKIPTLRLKPFRFCGNPSFLPSGKDGMCL